MKKAALFVSGLMASLVVLAAEPLNVKTGTWEITFVVEAGPPTLPPEVLAQMSPEQLAGMEAILSQGQALGAKPQTMQQCVTKADLAKPFEPAAYQDCETTILKSTATAQDVAVSCKGAHPAKGTMHIEASTPESMKATIDMALVGTEMPLKIKSQVSGRWLGSACKSEG